MIQRYFQHSFLLCAFALLVSTICQAQTITGKVVSIADGDTLTVLDANRTQYKIRLNGVDAPESAQAFGQASKRHLSDLVFGKVVSVEWTKRDKYGRIIGTVFLDGKNINLEQLKGGFAWFYRQYERDLEPARRKPYADAEAEAKAAKRGLWADPAPQPPWEFRHPPTVIVTRGDSSTPAQIVDGKIIGNRNSMIFHAPNCPDYSKVGERNRVPFGSEAEAVRAGYRKARNCP